MSLNDKQLKYNTNTLPQMSQESRFKWTFEEKRKKLYQPICCTDSINSSLESKDLFRTFSR